MADEYLIKIDLMQSMDGTGNGAFDSEVMASGGVRNDQIVTYLINKLGPIANVMAMVLRDGAGFGVIYRKEGDEHSVSIVGLVTPEDYHGYGWNFDMSAAPRGSTKTVSGPKGDREVFVRDVIYVAGDFPHVTLSYWIPKEGRWCMFTKENPPIAWRRVPAHPAHEGGEG